MTYPSWTEDRDVKRLGEQRDRLLGKVAPAQFEIRQATIILRRAEALAASTEARMLDEAPGRGATPAELLQCQQAAEQARTALQALKDANKNILEEFAKIDTQYSAATLLAQERAAVQLHKMLIEAGDDLEASLRSASQKNDAVSRLCAHIAVQFPNARMHVGGDITFNYRRLAEESIEMYHQHRIAMRAVSDDELKRVDAAAEAQRRAGEEREKQRRIDLVAAQQYELRRSWSR